MWQGKGIGAALMAQLIAVAKEKKMVSVWGLILAENTQMLALARKFDAAVQCMSGNQYELRIDFKNHSASGL